MASFYTGGTINLEKAFKLNSVATFLKKGSFKKLKYFMGLKMIKILAAIVYRSSSNFNSPLGGGKALLYLSIFINTSWGVSPVVVWAFRSSKRFYFWTRFRKIRRSKFILFDHLHYVIYCRFRIQLKIKLESEFEHFEHFAFHQNLDFWSKFWFFTNI